MVKKWITGYEGMYLVSDDGNVLSLARSQIRKDGKVLPIKEKILKKRKRGRDNLKYECVTLCKNGVQKNYAVHRLVANAFLPNPNNYKEVNHKDKNTFNNDVSNLEWCSRQYNIEYSKNKSVAQYDKNWQMLRKFKSIKEASLITKINSKSISNALNGWSKSAGGFMWKYYHD